MHVTEARAAGGASNVGFPSFFDKTVTRVCSPVCSLRADSMEGLSMNIPRILSGKATARPPRRCRIFSALSAAALSLVLCCSCTGTLFAPSYADRVESQAEMRRWQAVAALHAKETKLSMEVRIVTDSADATLAADMAAIRNVNGETFVHGTVRGNSGEYLAIPFRNIRRLSIDYPMVLRTKDERILKADGGDWSAIYQDGALQAIDLTDAAAAGDSARVVAAEDIRVLFAEAVSSSAALGAAKVADTMNTISDVAVLTLLAFFTIVSVALAVGG